MNTKSSASDLHVALIALGSNIAPERNLPTAVRQLATLGVVVNTSRVYQSKPVGFTEQGDFCNAAATLITSLSPTSLRVGLRQIETDLGRERDPANKNGPRTIDLDIACYDRLRVDTPTLQIPDPQISERPFLAIPLAELAPHEIPPGLDERLADIATRLTADSLKMRNDLLLDALPHADRIQGARTPAPSSNSLDFSPMDLNFTAISLRFCYGHRLLEYDGKCRHLHGHTARVELLLDGEVSPEQWESHRSDIQQWVDDTLNARMILCQNDPALEAMGRLGEPVHLVESNPTTENIARLIFHQAETLHLPIAQVRMWESPRCSAIYMQPTAVSEP